VLHLSSTLKLQWLGQVFAHLLRLPLEWFERRHTGDVWSRFAAVQQIQDALSMQFSEAVIDGLMVLLTLVLMLAYSPALTAVAVAAVALYAALRWALYRPMKEASEEALVHEARKQPLSRVAARGGRDQAVQCPGRRQSRFLNLVVDAMNASLVARRHELVLAVGQRLIFGLERVAVVWLGALAVMDQQISTGMLFAFLAYQEQFATRFGALIDKAGELQLLRLQGERLADIVRTPPEEDAGAPLPAGTELAGRLTVRGLRFRYADVEAEVLQDISFSVAPGESVAITGPSGGGKTTLLKLLLGIYGPQAGEICIDGLPLARLGRARWRNLIGTVMQDEPLFAGSIADNIAFFAPDPDRDWIEACARQAAVHEEILAMPMGYATLVGDMGTSLSGGQKQRILLARALYKRPRILLLDEATSALDVDRERRVNQAVQQLQLTRIIVAHRPETIASAQRVLVLKTAAWSRTARRRLTPPLSSLHRAGLDAQHRVERADAQGTGGQRHDADPAPDADGAGQGEGDQHEADEDAGDAVETADIGLHESLLVLEGTLPGAHGCTVRPASGPVCDCGHTARTGTAGRPPAGAGRRRPAARCVRAPGAASRPARNA
jgi:ATP-binding cassette subfamily B protein RaxB